MNKLIPGCVAEFLGTFALVFFGVAAMVMTTDQTGGAGNLVTVALAHGLVLVVFVTACMYISGGQFNPAVSLGLIVAGKQDVVTAGAYIVTQLVAAACATGMIVMLLPEAAVNAANFGATVGELTKLPEQAGLGKVMGLEVLMAFALMFVYITTVVDDRSHKLGGLCVGLTVMMGIVAFGPMTGASMNPARTFGPALYGDMHGMLWVYVVAHIVGAVLAVLVYRSFWRGWCCEERTNCCESDESTSSE